MAATIKELSPTDVTQRFLITNPILNHFFTPRLSQTRQDLITQYQNNRTPHSTLYWDFEAIDLESNPRRVYEFRFLCHVTGTRRLFYTFQGQWLQYVIDRNVQAGRFLCLGWDEDRLTLRLLPVFDPRDGLLLTILRVFDDRPGWAWQPNGVPGLVLPQVPDFAPLCPPVGASGAPAASLALKKRPRNPRRNVIVFIAPTGVNAGSADDDFLADKTNAIKDVEEKDVPEKLSDGKVSKKDTKPEEAVEQAESLVLEETSPVNDEKPGEDTEMAEQPAANKEQYAQNKSEADCDARRGGFGDSMNAGNIHREGLMTYKQFIQELEDDVSPSVADRRHQEYKSEYIIATPKRKYFEAHKDDEWFKNKYHPTNLLTVIERRDETARKVAKDFLLDLHSGILDRGPNAIKAPQTSEPNSEDDTDVGVIRRRQGRPQGKDSDLFTAPRAPTISSEPRRIQADIELAQALMAKLDTEKGIEDNILTNDDTEQMNRERSHSGSISPVIIIRGLTSVKGLEGAELLETLLTYLWRVHAVDYYGMIETAEPKGLRHVRGEGKNPDTSSQAQEWEKKLDVRWQDRMRGTDPLEARTANEKLDAAGAEALDPFVRKIRDEKYGWKYGYGAKGCTKLFHASEYVQTSEASETQAY